VVQEFNVGSYTPPVLRPLMSSGVPPHTIHLLIAAIHCALDSNLAEGAFVVVIAVQESVTGSYLPPVLRPVVPSDVPPHTSISVPVQTELCEALAEGAPTVEVAVQLPDPVGGGGGGVVPPPPPPPPPHLTRAADSIKYTNSVNTPLDRPLIFMLASL